MIVALIGKTEGNGGANDFTRGFATLSYQSLLAKNLAISPQDVGKRIAFVWSGGTEGVLSPHAFISTRTPAQGDAGRHQAVGDRHHHDRYDRAGGDRDQAACICCRRCCLGVFAGGRH